MYTNRLTPSISPIIITLLFALTTWLGRKDFVRTRSWYIYGPAMLLYAVVTAIEGFTERHIPPVLRVARFLCLALLVLAVFLCWPREKT